MSWQAARPRSTRSSCAAATSTSAGPRFASVLLAYVVPSALCPCILAHSSVLSADKRFQASVYACTSKASTSRLKTPRHM